MTDNAIIALAAALTIALSTVFPALAQGKTADCLNDPEVIKAYIGG